MMREYVEGIPSGLIACRVGNTNAHILGISPRGVVLRSAAPLPRVPITFYFYQSETGSYLSHTLNSYETGEARRENGAVLSRFSFEDAACATLIRRALNTLARYVETRSTEGASAYGRETTGYPLEMDEIFPESIEEARRAWFSRLPSLNPGEGCSLAVALNCRELWELYLNKPVAEFMDAYARIRQIPRDVLPRRTPERLYIGNAYCRLVFPEQDVLAALLSKAQYERLAVTLVTAELRAGDEGYADDLLSLAAERGLELEINDWGMLNRAQPFREKLTLLLGTRLNRRRKDPRMQWKAGYAGHEDLLSRNALNDASYRDFLMELGISRFEYESCGLPTIPPDAPCSLHLPFYQTNTSLWCPLRAVCMSSDRGRQTPADNCPHWCQENALLYPLHLGMLGRWNSLLALDRELTHVRSGFDRWVLNF